MQLLKDYISQMWSYFVYQITAMTVLDVIDIIFVSIVIYCLYLFIRDRRAGKLAVGVIFLFLLQLLSNILGLMAMQFIMQNVFQAGLIAIIIVFQPELRSALEKMGGQSIRGLKSIAEQKDSLSVSVMINDLCEAVCDLSKDKTGALIVIEQSTKLGDVVKSGTGTVINADISPFLIKNIFFNKAPLHDGAMLIRGQRIYAAGCILPLSANNDIIKDLGTRHRAAIGMSENSDAVVIVVSEETGTISIAREGRLYRNFNYNTLHAELENLLINSPRGTKVPSRRKQRNDIEE